MTQRVRRRVPDGSERLSDADVDTSYSLVAAVPLPGVAWPVGEEVSRPLVLDPLRKPQQHPVVVVSRSVG